jgi:vitamin B12/bleomycin/antimicrobial peptide transport system ATP-binding/permease protein
MIVPQEIQAATANTPERAHFPQVLRRFARLAGPFWFSRHKRKIWFLTIGLLVMTVMQVELAVVTNAWSARLFDALERRSMGELINQISTIVAILFANVAVTVIHLRTKRRLQMSWRHWLTRRLTALWMHAGRHNRVTQLHGNHDNPDGRIAEDIRIATEYALDLCHSLFYTFLLLLSFSQILWKLSGVINVPIGEVEYLIPGYLVWLAVIYAGAASLMGWAIGRPMITATDSRQTREANFRFGLARARENSEAIALAGGEASERERISELFQGVADAWQRQTRALSNIMMFTSGYSVLSMAFPILVSAPRYVVGSISLGVLMQSAQGMQQMASALSWPVDNLTKMAEWRASVERVLGLALSLDTVDDEMAHTSSRRIEFIKGNGLSLRFDQLGIADLDGELLMADLTAEIRPGEHVYITGDSFCVARMVRVLARLWPWGRGQIELPRGEPIFFMPPRPYLPIGSLRAAVCYPSTVRAFVQDQVVEAMVLAGLGECIDRLHDVDVWATVLSQEEQQQISVARILLHRPNWILIYDNADSPDPSRQAALLHSVRRHVPDAGVLTFNSQPAASSIHDQVLTLQRNQHRVTPIKEGGRSVDALKPIPIPEHDIDFDDSYRSSRRERS